jgi:ABC-2 type transport system permease protein
VTAATVDVVRPGAAPPRPTRAAASTAFRAMLLRDLRVLRKSFATFAVRTIMQPLLLVFVFTYVFPKIGEGIGGSSRAQSTFSTLLMAGVVATSMVFQGVQAVALPLVQEFGYTREIEDRVMAPLPVWAVAVEKIVSGAVQGLLAALVVFPLALFIPATPVHLTVRWGYLLTLAPIASWVGAALGLVM